MSRASEFLWQQFQLRKQKNPRYSQGAFAKTLGITTSRVGQYFSGKRLITKTAAAKIASKLHLSHEDHERFVAFCIQAKAEKKSPKLSVLTEDQLALTVEWYHFALFQLMFTKDFKLDSQWIADRLGISPQAAEESLQRLSRMGFVIMKDGKAEARRGGYTTPADISVENIRKGHKNMLYHLAETFEQVPPEQRDVSNITVAIDSKNIPKAKKLIRGFRQKLATLMSEGKCDEVYSINIQLCPLTREII